MEAKEIQRIPYPEHPNRCQNVSGSGQCVNLAVENGTYCFVHGGNKQINAQKAAELKNYRLGQWQARINRFTESSEIKSLREEIGILRILVEERLNFCQDSRDLIFMSTAISELIMKIEKVVSSCHRLEASLGQHLDKVSLMHFAEQVINIISINVEKEKLDDIATNIVDLIER